MARNVRKAAQEYKSRQLIDGLVELQELRVEIEQLRNLRNVE